MNEEAQPDPGSPQSILAALLADFSWELVPDPLPSSVFVKLLELLGIDAAFARVAIERVCKKGLLDKVPSEGRGAQYRLSASAAERRIRAVTALMRAGNDVEPWDGTWTLLISSVPESRKVVRARMRTLLLAAGFARQYDAVWVKPNRASVAAAQLILKDLEIEQATVYSATHATGPAGAQDPLTAFSLGAVHERYAAFVRDFEKIATARMVKRAAVDCLSFRIKLVAAWHSVVKDDPMLPNELLPTGFARERAREVFLSTYDALGPGAEACVREAAQACGLGHLPLHHFPALRDAPRQ